MKMKELFTDKSKWTQGTHARNAAGVCVASESEHAVCWCLMGAMTKG